jgi:hypothetical protein
VATRTGSWSIRSQRQTGTWFNLKCTSKGGLYGTKLGFRRGLNFAQSPFEETALTIVGDEG